MCIMEKQSDACSGQLDSVSYQLCGREYFGFWCFSSASESAVSAIDSILFLVTGRGVSLLFGRFYYV